MAQKDIAGTAVLAGIASQSPGIKERLEDIKFKKEAQKWENAADKILKVKQTMKGKSWGDVSRNVIKVPEDYAELKDKQIEAIKKSAEINPSQKNIDAYINSRNNWEAEKRRLGLFSPQAQAASKAEKHMKDAQEAKAVQRTRRNFKAAIQDEPVSIGGQVFSTVGKLGVQDAYAKQFTKKQKTDYLNNKEKRNGSNK